MSNEGHSEDQRNLILKQIGASNFRYLKIPPQETSKDDNSDLSIPNVHSDQQKGFTRQVGSSQTYSAKRLEDQPNFTCDEGLFASFYTDSIRDYQISSDELKEQGDGLDPNYMSSFTTSETSSSSKKDPNVCEFCSESFSTSLIKEIHTRNRHMSELLQIRKSIEAFGPKELKKTYICTECRMTFENPKFLTNHRRIHSRQRAMLFSVTSPVKKSKLTKGYYKCPVCHIRLGEHDALTIHFADFHPIENAFKCHICSKFNLNGERLQAHLNDHKENNTTFKCDLCPATFIFNNEIVLHSKKHDGKGAFNCFCDLCGFNSKIPKELSQHMKCHRENRNKIIENFMGLPRSLGKEIVETPQQDETIQQVETPETDEMPKLFEMTKQVEMPNQVESPETIKMPKLFEMTKQFETPKQDETTQTVETQQQVKTNQTTQRVETPKQLSPDFESSDIFPLDEIGLDIPIIRPAEVPLIKLFNCKQCNRLFAKEHHLALHKKIAHPSSSFTTLTFKCLVCGFSFPTRFDVCIHIQNSHATLLTPECRDNLPMNANPTNPRNLYTAQQNSRKSLDIYNAAGEEKANAKFNCQFCPNLQISDVFEYNEHLKTCPRLDRFPS